MFSILHISDLHRSTEEPVDNDTLIACLVTDCDRYMGETPKVPPPNAIIVSGDIIQGARIGDPHWKLTMRDQYMVAEQFLSALSDRFLGGDRSKLILAPGNHDVCWNTSLAAMEKVPDREYPSDVRRALLEPDSNYRWSWKARELYKINDRTKYEERLDAYWEFFHSFYKGHALLTEIDRNRGYQLFELNNKKIVVAAFESIANNDCFCSSGGIRRGAVSRCNLDLRDTGHEYDVRIAVWHHCIQGPPLRDDYMDVKQINEMAGLGFQLGVHGHQHIAAASTHYVHLGEGQSMAVVCSGSLCAGAKELPRGVNRQYNIIVMDDSLEGARVHVREMTDFEHFSRKSGGAFSDGFNAVKWTKPINLLGQAVRTEDKNLKRVTLLAEDALHAFNPKRALEILSDIDLTPNSHARRIALQSAIKVNDWHFIIKSIPPPYTNEENVIVVTALTKSGSLEKAEDVLRQAIEVDGATRSDLIGKIEIQKMLRGEAK